MQVDSRTRLFDQRADKERFLILSSYIFAMKFFITIFSFLSYQDNQPFNFWTQQMISGCSTQPTNKP
jgi:hypothetical protein